MLDAARVKQDFPVFDAYPDLVYLDSTATSQKPRAVIDAMTRFQAETNANPHRGIYALAEAATTAYEQARADVARFLGADPQTLVWTRNATEAINLVARAWGATNLGPKDTVVLTVMEHHSNIVPWQLLAKEKGFRIHYLPITKEGRLDMAKAREVIRPGVKLLSFAHMSNLLGVVNPVKDLIELAHRTGAIAVVDGAQAAAHLPVNVQELGADCYAFSGHKMLGPFGIGGLLAKRELLEAMPPYQGGGDMIREVTLDGATWNDVPQKFEAGTPNAVGAIGLATAVEYLTKLGMENVWQHEHDLAEYTLQKLDELPGVTTYGPHSDDRGGVIAFTIKDVHPHDIASMLDEQGIAVRAGHHCAQPLHAALGIPSSARASFGVYTLKEDVDALVGGIKKVLNVFM
ncbi:MAG: SufS family cysteine desulfurase [Candidatus Kerfeldbacteria bacterium]|nr:SufS family cysteine desulfurase [Candidatus Kerfeldbacteria bacterium]